MVQEVSQTVVTDASLLSVYHLNTELSAFHITFRLFPYKIPTVSLKLTFNMPPDCADLSAADSRNQVDDTGGKSADQNVTGILAADEINLSLKEPSKKRKASDLGADSESWCQRCRLMTGSITGLRSLMSAEGFKHLSLPALRQSAAAGCSSCSFFLSHFKKILRKWDDDSIFHLQDKPYSRGIRFEDRKYMKADEFYIISS